MKLEIILFLFTLILAFISGNINYSIRSQKKGTLSDIEEIRNLHFEIQEELTPYKRLDLNLDYPTPEHLKLLEVIPKITKPPLFFLNSAECLRTKLSQISSNYINKETLWMAFLCNQVDKLPFSFFKSPPFIHESGVSYAYMRYKMTRAHSERLRWLESHAKYMHIKELKKLQYPTNINQKFLINQPQEVINKIINKDQSFLTNEFYFIKTGHFKYFIIENLKARRFFSRAGYDLSLDKKGCLFTAEEVCWKKRTKNLQSFLTQSTTVLFILTIIFLGITATGLYQRLKKKKLEEERKKHALRVLTHELRTPIASLILQTDELHRSLEDLPTAVQDKIISIEGQIYRLKHLAQKSQSYLQTDDTKLIQLKNQKILSLVEFIEDILIEYEAQKINFSYNQDTSITADPYWLKMCISNLIENAIRYGKGQIEINLNTDHQWIKITIKDEGSIPFKSLKELLKAKHTKSKGLGLGLNIVSKTLKEMNAKLKLTPNPTSFTIEINKEKEEENE